MPNKIRTLASDTLTRERITEAVEGFARRHCKSGTVYDIGGVRGHPYGKFFSDYRTINIDRKERPDVLANAERLPFKDNAIENMMCIAMLEHVKDPEAIVREMHRVMKKRGRALVWVPFYWREHNYPIDICRFTRQGINALLERHGFRIIESESAPYSGFFFVLSHNVRFLMKDPHKARYYDPLLYLHAILCYMSRLDSVFKLEYPHVYTGVEVVE
ncbi:MAG: class I SAM-dependent methyltransferase [Candidatus Micrarchaeaceae archaeon]